MKSQLTCIICNQKLSAKTTEHKCNYRNNHNIEIKVEKNTKDLKVDDLKIDDLKIDTVNK